MTIGQPVLNLLVFVRSLSCARAKEKGLVLNAHTAQHTGSDGVVQNEKKSSVT